MCETFKTLVLLLLACTSVPLAAGELRLLTEDAPPMSFVDGAQVSGMSVEVVRALIERTGDTARIELVPWTRAIHLTRLHADTALFSTVRTPEREAQFQWVGPILVGTTRFYSLTSRGVVVNSLQDAADSGPLAVPKQWYTYETLASLGFNNLYGVPSPKQMLAMLKRGRVKLIATEDLTLAGELASVDLSPMEVNAHIPIMHSAYYIAFSLLAEPEQVARWQRALTGMHEDGSLEAILKHWLPEAELPPLPL